MSSAFLQDPVEGPAPVYTGAPEDQQPVDLEGGLAMVESIIFRDGGMDQQEQAMFRAWVQKIILRAAEAAQQGMQSPDQQAGLGASSAQSNVGPIPGYAASEEETY